MNILRKLYYAVPASWRLRLRVIVFWPYDLLFPPGHYHGIPLPLRGKIFTGAGQFIATGERLVQFAERVAHLRPLSTVLDIGCGLGRLAYPLSQKLVPPGNYIGFDPMPEAIAWCEQHFQKFAWMRFVHAGLFNDLYNDHGPSAQNFKFPVESSSREVIFAISVFTHLLPEEVINYLKEIKRTLAPGGHAFITLFLLSPDTVPNPAFPFKYQFGYYSVMSTKVWRANVAFQLRWLTEQVLASGLSIKVQQRGSWQGSPLAWDFQDVIVLTHASES